MMKRFLLTKIHLHILFKKMFIRIKNDIFDIYRIYEI